MDSLLLRLMILAALGEVGMATLTDDACMSRKCVANIERASRDITRIEWKPIVVFPEEAARFAVHQRSR